MFNTNYVYYLFFIIILMLIMIDTEKCTTVGIDLGTSNCCISYITDEGAVEIIRDPNHPDKVTIPSMIDVSLLSEGMILVGNEIDKKHISHNKNIFHSFKRLIGHNINDVFATNLREILGYRIDSHNDNIVCYDTNGRMFSLQEVIFLLLRKIKTMIENHFNGRLWNCIVTVPAYFNETQRQITIDAIRITGLPFIKLLNEPTSASFAYLYYNKVLSESTFDKKILVIDYGAGTLDLTVLEITRDDSDMDGTTCEVLGSYGDNNFGGIDITKKIYKTMFNNSTIDLNLKMQIAEEIKLILSSQQNASYYCSELDKTFTYLYEVFLLQMKEFCDHIISIIDETLLIADLEKHNIDDIILVGGSFKNFYFRKHISDYFSKQIIQPRMKISHEKSLTGHTEVLLYEDIAVSLGAAIYGYYTNMSKDVVLVDRIPLSIGIETINEQVVRIIERNSIMPISRKQTFQPENNEQTDIVINIYQGESMFIKNCQHIGQFTLYDIPNDKTKLSKPIIYVSIEVDHNGIISITAYDKNNISCQTFKISSKSIALSDEEIEKIMTHYQISIFDEQLHRDIIKNYYDLISIIDKISHQINYNTSLELNDEIKAIMRTDIELIINKMDNRFIMKKYSINKKLIAKVIIINKLKFITKEVKPLNSSEINDFSQFLITLKYYLIDRYELYLNIEYDMGAANQVVKMETLTDEIDTLDNNVESTALSDKIDLTEFSDLINRDELNAEEEYVQLKAILEENILLFGLTDEGIQLLTEKLLEPVENDKHAEKVNEINEYCIFLKNSYEK